MPGSTAGIMNVSATTRCAFAAEDTSQATNREVTTAKWRTGFLSRRSSFLHRQLQSADELARHSPHHPSCGAAGARFRVCIIIHVCGCHGIFRPSAPPLLNYISCGRSEPAVGLDTQLLLRAACLAAGTDLKHSNGCFFGATVGPRRCTN